MLREEYGHSYRQCPVCKKEGLPKGIIVCCQNQECYHIIDTSTGNDLGEYMNWGGITDRSGKDKYKEVTMYQKIYQFVYSLSQQDMVILEQVINDKRKRYGGGPRLSPPKE